MHRVSRALAALVILAAAAAPAAASKLEKSETLVNLHDLKSTVAIGDYFLKQQSVLAAREYLENAGSEQRLGPGWNRDNPDWQKAEAAMVGALMRRASRQFSSLEWLSQEWVQINEADFDEQEMDLMLRHFRSDVGRKQAMIVDHSVAFHVMASLSLAGKIQEHVPGTEADCKRMQDLFNAEDEAMRFDPNTNPEGTQFAFSSMGKKYFINAVLKVSGLISRRLYQTAAEIPAWIPDAASAAAPWIEAYRTGRKT